ncbi:MAG: His/Gly/Thr/Pro-type tRNA ligase C-terminal domain-containing protein, partial [Candidatus Promineifilaceae bacterium]
DRKGATFVLVIGESEVENNTVTVRPLEGGDQVTIPASSLVDWMKNSLL